jgi:phytoene dehydrogenase-like protein
MTVHIVGAGLAGLAAAMAGLEQDLDIRVYEAAPMAGGRCRSYHDPVLDRRIDTGTHLVLGANRAVLGYLDRLGARDRMVETAPAAYPFFDLASGRRWTVRASLPGLLSAFHPVTVAALNTEPREASWRLILSVFARLLRERDRRPWIARHGIGEALIDPAAARLGERLALGTRLTGLELSDDRATALAFGERNVTLGAEDAVILAVPPAMAFGLVPDLTVPTEFRAIVNAHFRSSETSAAPRLLGLTGGLAQWLLWRGDIVSATISAADALLGETSEALAAKLWAEVRRAFDLGGPLPPFRIVKERRATIAATPAQERRRPASRTRWSNLFLAGDWTRTGLPGTLEGAVLSGERAMRLAQRKILQ